LLLLEKLDYVNDNRCADRQPEQLITNNTAAVETDQSRFNRHIAPYKVSPIISYTKNLDPELTY